jgi:hypothetical protein
MNKRPLRLFFGPAAFLAASYGLYVGSTWLWYGRHPRSAKPGEADPLLDDFMPVYEVVERHSTRVRAPAEVTFGAACEMDFEESPVARTIFKVRQLLLRAGPAIASPRGLLARTKALGWGVLAEIPGREIVMGAVTQPWVGNVIFRGLAPEEFVSFHDPGYVKIAWTLRADPVNPAKSIFRTETRVLACGPVARSKFRKYWAFLSPGIILIRLAMLAPMKREAERRARAASGATAVPVDLENHA